VNVAIIGGGAAGISMGIALKRAGHEFTILERSPEVGGTWRDNIYPGAACDVPSHLYCFSFEPKADWNRKFALQPEIRAYLAHCAERYGLLPHLRLGTEVQAATFRDDRWHVRTSTGELVVDAIVSGTGQLNRPRVPALADAAVFRGAQFHSARWPADYDSTGRDIAVVGCGASAIQIVPEVAKRARSVTVVQRTPAYVIARHDRAFRRWEKWMFAHVPFVRRWYRALIYARNESLFPALYKGSLTSRIVHWLAIRHMRKQIKDPALRAALTPDYPIGCKRILISDDWYPALARDNVHLVTSPPERLTADAIVTADGAAHAVDTIVYATGFDTTSFLAPIDIVGKGGIHLAEAWKTGAEAHHGITVAGFPNLFLLYGPNTNLGHNSILFMIECQVRYISRCLEELERRGACWLDIHPDAMADYNAKLQRTLSHLVWDSCTNWYTTNGKVTNNWSGRTTRYWWQNRKPEFADYDFRAAEASTAIDRAASSP
jgi:cation diffusion facilitator CzcD-associated flavoprotein CzcO